MSRQRNRALGWLGIVVVLLANVTTALAQGGGLPPGGERVFTADQAAGTVTAFDTNKGATLAFRVPRTTPLPAYPALNGPTMIALDPFVATLLVTEEIGASVVVVDPKSNDSNGLDSQGGPGTHGGQIAGRIPLSIPLPWGVSITPDGHIAFIGNAERALFGLNTATSDLVSVIDVFRGIELKTINVSAQGAGPIDVACSPDGLLCWVACSATNNVVAIDVPTLTLHPAGAGFPVALPGAGTPVDICVTVATPGHPSGTFVYVAKIQVGGAGSVNFFDVATRTPGTVAGLPATAQPFDVFTNYKADRFYIVDNNDNAVFVGTPATQTVIAQVLPAGVGLAAPQQGCIDPANAFGYVSVTGGVREFNASSNLFTPTVFPADAGPNGITLFQIQDEPVTTKQEHQRNVQQGTAGSKKGLCFIATASYGDSPEVAALRAFRDLYLMPTKFGRAFVDLYYESSPGVASLIADREPVAATVRGGLAPVVLLARLVMSLGAMLPSIAGLLALGAVSLLVGRRLRIRPRKAA